MNAADINALSAAERAAYFKSVAEAPATAAAAVEEPVATKAAESAPATAAVGAVTENATVAAVDEMSVELAKSYVRSIIRDLRDENCVETDLTDKAMARAQRKLSPQRAKALVIEHLVDECEEREKKKRVKAKTRTLLEESESTLPAGVELDRSESASRPTFPIWAIHGTSIYENLVKPACATSSKFEEFIFMPAIQIMMNHLAGKVQIAMQPTNLNLFLGLVSPYGQFFKSTSCSLAQQYFQNAQILNSRTKDSVNLESKVVIAQAGSPEGFGMDMQKINAKHAIMFNDELGKLVSKAGIDGSSFSSDLLSWYGSAYFGNLTKTTKNNFAFLPGDYTFGWMWCTTDRNFNRYWPKLAGVASGIEDRMFFVVSPEKPKVLGTYSDPDAKTMFEGAARTKALMEMAVNQRTYRVDCPEFFNMKIEGLDARSLDLVKKLSLYFAVDLGLDAIDEDCVDRARVLVNYRNQAAAFLEPIEADNNEGRLQKEMVRELKQNRGEMTYRDFCLNLDYSRYGARLWDLCFNGLKRHGDIIEFHKRTTPGKRASRMVGLVKHDD